LVVLQQERVQKAIQLEQQVGNGVILPVVGHEIDRLARLWDDYDRACDHAGLIRPDRAALEMRVKGETVNVHVLLQQQINALPESLRRRFADVLREARELREAQEIAVVDAEVAKTLPKPNGQSH